MDCIDDIVYFSVYTMHRLNRLTADMDMGYIGGPLFQLPDTEHDLKYEAR